MRRFMLLIKATPAYEAGKLPDEQTLQKLADFTQELIQAGALVGCERLEPSSQGVRVHFAKGKFTVTDGPFAETKELVAGFCLIQAKSLAEAVGWAQRIPLLDEEIEVRPLFELEDFPVDPAEKPAGWRDNEQEMRAAPPPARKPGTTRYIGLLKADPDTEAGVLPDEQVLSAMGAFMEEGVKAEILLSGEGLMPSSQSARVRVSGDKRMVVDGPFAETKELVAGYAILQFASRDEAIAWTRRFVQVDAPGRYGAECVCELRPIFEYDQYGDSPAIRRFRELGAAAPE